MKQKPNYSQYVEQEEDIFRYVKNSELTHSGPTEVEDCSLPPPNMAATKTGEQGKVWFSDL